MCVHCALNLFKFVRMYVFMFECTVCLVMRVCLYKFVCVYLCMGVFMYVICILSHTSMYLRSKIIKKTILHRYINISIYNNKWSNFSVCLCEMVEP